MINVLVLGAEGMVGREVFKYLTLVTDLNVWGTSRNKTGRTGKLLFFDARTYDKDLKKILITVENIDYIINCIGILNEKTPLSELIYSNSLFPHLLEEIAAKLKSKLIHISTDAVFSPLCGTVTEFALPSPIDNYGMSKKLGETIGKNALTIRSSFIGLDPLNHKGLLEQILSAKREFPGYTNQLWTGCTTLQFAQFCKYLMTTGSFIKVRKQTNIVHFAPLGPLSKYKLVKTFSLAATPKLVIKRTKGEKRKRILTSHYFDLLKMNQYTSSIDEDIKELLDFEKFYEKK
jgi:dTDP-4-dehydrorhamnose reductase